MRALMIVDGEAGRLAMRDVEPPEPAGGEALVAVAASSVNRGELSLIARRPAGWRPGQDVAGVVLEPAADGSGPAAGTRVAGLADQGAWSAQVAVPADRLVELPPSVTAEQAVTLPLAGVTALRTLRLGGPLAGRSVLVTGAAGGLGTLQVQLAVAAGAHVTAVSSRPEAAAALAELGVPEVVADIADATGPYDVIAESVGGRSLAAAIRAVAPGGTIVVLGNSSGEPTPVSLYDFIGHEDARLQTYFSYADHEGVAGDLATLVGLVADGGLVPRIGLAEPWERFPSALAAVRDRTVTGKVVLRIAGSRRFVTARPPRPCPPRRRRRPGGRRRCAPAGTGAAAARVLRRRAGRRRPPRR
ncbi:NADPH:quinone reductase [Amycolatopsis australiensis]|uniref:NADPH:quinone reductase n=1 Tax=Amycolatopsis australiensis TaxID=546364 RepID=A0A1K1S460_9PSEU|nr:NADPH:quinone reductase [Amycolatopsis australiensis]